MLNVLITVKATQKTLGEPPQIIEFTSEGKYYERMGAIFLVYEESELSGFPGHKTTLKIHEDHVTMRRYGANTSSIHFEKGVREDSEYETPYGVFKLETLTHRLEMALTEVSGEVTIEYALSIQGVHEAMHTLVISYRAI